MSMNRHDFAGGMQVKLVDDSEKINAGLGAWNESQGYPPKEGCGCRLPGRPAESGAAAFTLGGLALLATRRRPRARRAT